MKKQEKTQDENLDRLREKAEAIQQKIKAQAFGKLNNLDAQKLIEELHLYQIELEMQNEQLRLVTEELEQSVIKYEDLYEFAPVGYVTLDEFGLVLEANLTAGKILHLDRRQLKQSRFSRYIAPEDFNAFTGFLRRMLQTEDKQSTELTFIRPDHTVFEVRLEGVSFELRSPKRQQCRVAILDISEQKAAERSMRQSEDFVKKIAETMPDILTVYDLETQQNLYGNRNILNVLGISSDKIQNLRLSQRLALVHPEDQALFTRNMENLVNLKSEEIKEFEYRIKDQAGNYHWLNVRSVIFQFSASGKPSQVLSIEKDITQEKETQADLLAKNKIVEGLLASLPISVSLIDREGTYLKAAGSGLARIGFKPNGADLVNKNAFNLFPEIEASVRAAFTGRIVDDIIKVPYAGGTQFLQNYYLLDKHANAVISFAINVTKQREAEETIFNEREFSQSLLDNSTDGILAFDSEFNFTAWNKVLESNTRFSRESMLGKNIFKRFPTLVGTEIQRALQKVLKGEKLVLFNQSFGLKNAHYEIYLNPLHDAEGHISGGLATLHNVFMQKKLETEATNQKLLQQKTVLNAILNTQEVERKRISESLHNGVGQLLYAAKLNLDRNPKNEKAVEEKTGNAEGQKILRELLDEAIREIRTISFELMPSILEDFGLETAVSELISRICRSGLDLKCETLGLQRFPPVIEISAYRIIQELLNNIIKHSEATEAVLEIIARKKTLTITAKDNGKGFCPNQQENLNGIGLTSIQNRVKLLDGKMEIDSEPGKGTCISIQLPTT